MRDCSNAEMRDALPDLMHGRLADDRRATVQRHVDGCADCRAELALLERVRGSVPVPAIDPARIVAALPAAPGRTTRRVPAASTAWRVAAAVLLLVGSGTVLDRVSGPDGVPGPDTLVRIANAAPAELSPGASIQDISDSELRALVDVIDTLDAVMQVEPERITVPLAPSEGS